MLPVWRPGLARASPSLNVGRRRAAPARVCRSSRSSCTSAVAQLGIRLGGLDQRRGERLVGRRRLGLGPLAVGRAAQGERLMP